MDTSSDSSSCSIHNSSKQESLSEVIDVTVTKNVAQRVQKMDSKGLLERRVSPRLKNIPEDKRPYYGSDQMRQLYAPKDDVCSKETVDSDRKRQLDSTKHNACKKKAKADCAMQESLLAAARTDVEDQGTENDLALCSTQHDDMDIMDLEEDAYLKWTDYKSFIDESDCQRAPTRIRETLRNFNKHYLRFVQVISVMKAFTE